MASSKFSRFVVSRNDVMHLSNEEIEDLVFLTFREDEKIEKNQQSLNPAGVCVIHFDSHPEVVIPGEYNWIMRKACEANISTIAWVKPPWATNVIKDGTYNLIIGRDDSGEIGICNTMPLFISTCSYRPLKKLKNRKRVILVVATLGKHKAEDIPAIIRKLTSMNYKNEKFILSVDLDFFSTCNPYKNLYDKVNLYRNLFEIYFYGLEEHITLEEADRHMKSRLEQLNEIHQLWAQIAVEGLDAVPTASSFHREGRALATALLNEYSEVDWEQIHQAGCSFYPDGEPLVQNLTSREHIMFLVNTFGRFIKALPQKPTSFVFQMGNSFCPEEDKSFILYKLLSFTEAKFAEIIKLNI